MLLYASVFPRQPFFCSLFCSSRPAEKQQSRLVVPIIIFRTLLRWNCVEAMQGTAAVPLLKDTIGANKVEKIFEAVDGTGGHPYPSNFFTEFRVFALTANGDSLVYEGVKNSDWQQENNDKDVIDLVLKIDL